MNRGDFVHLHLHTHYSLLDGMIKPKELVNRAKEFGMPAVAVTDHGVLYGIYDFYINAKNAGIKPIIGGEFYLVDEYTEKDKPFHIILLAKNDTGLKNLIELGTKAFLEGFYKKPRIRKKDLFKHREGLIVLSACKFGEPQVYLLNGQKDKAIQVIKEYKEVFGEDYYLEVQNHEPQTSTSATFKGAELEQFLESERLIFEEFLDIGDTLGIKCVLTNDAHYLNREDWEVHDVLLAIQTKKKVTDKERMRFPTKEYYFKDAEEMLKVSKGIKELLLNTLEIADKVEGTYQTFENKGYLFPEVQGVDDYEKELRKLAYEGFEKKLKQGKIPLERKEEYRKRLEEELKIINDMKFPGYFLIVRDFIKWAKDNGIPVGPGRGSAAGSLVSYLIGITEIDPIPFNLLFERFLNPERVTMPDIDIDFCKENREKVIEYVKEKYGKDRVSMIITYGTFGPKMAVREVMRAFNRSPSEIDKYSTMIDKDVKTLDEVFQALPELENILTEVEKQVIRRIEGLIKQVGVHAAGVIIAPDKLTKFVPLCLDKDKRVTSQFDMGMVESLGLLKMDFLGLDTLTIIDNAVRNIKKNYGVEIDIYNLPLDDEKTFVTLQKGDTTGVFQLESEGMKNLLRKLKPERFEELIALVALYRPGPLSSGMVDSYIKRKHGLEEVDYIFPELEPVLKETYGLFIYQEQIMQIANILAGYSLGEADLLRRAMGKKKKEIMEEQRKIFIERAVKNGYPKEKIEHLFDQIAKFAEYGFNKSHSTAYAYLSYVTAYLKTHYPVEFYASIMSVQYSKRDKLLRVIKDAKEHGIEILPPDVNVSEEDFKAVNGKIYYSLSGIKGIEKETAGLIVEERKKNGEFKSFNDFKSRFKGVRRINKKVLEKLTMAGAFDSIEDRKKLISSLKGIEEQLISDRILMEYERETLGLYIKNNPLDQVKWFPYKNPDPETFVADKEVEIFGIISNLEVKARKNQSKWAKMELLTDHYSIQITVSGYVLEKYYPYLAEGNFISVKGIVAISEDDKENKTVKVRAKEIKHISELLNLTGYYELDARGKASEFQERVFKLSKQIKHDDNGIPFVIKAELEDAEVLMKVKDNVSLDSPIFQNGAGFAIIKPKKQNGVVSEKSSKNSEDPLFVGAGDDNLFT